MKICFSPKKKAQQENTSHGRTLYKSDGNSKTVDNAEVCGQPKSLASRTFKIWSKVLVFGQVHLIYIVLIS